MDQSFDYFINFPPYIKKKQESNFGVNTQTCVFFETKNIYATILFDFLKYTPYTGAKLPMLMHLSSHFTNVSFPRGTWKMRESRCGLNPLLGNGAINVLPLDAYDRFNSEETVERQLERFTPSASSASFYGRDWRRSSNWQCWWRSPTSSGLPNVNPAACARN